MSVFWGVLGNRFEKYKVFLPNLAGWYFEKIKNFIGYSFFRESVSDFVKIVKTDFVYN